MTRSKPSHSLIPSEARMETGDAHVIVFTNCSRAGSCSFTASGVAEITTCAPS
jgi:hypothetical protein